MFFFAFRFLKHNTSKLKQNKSAEFSKVKEKPQSANVIEVTNEVEKLQTKDENKNLTKEKIPQVFQAGRNKILYLITF